MKSRKGQGWTWSGLPRSPCGPSTRDVGLSGRLALALMRAAWGDVIGRSAGEGRPLALVPGGPQPAGPGSFISPSGALSQCQDAACVLEHVSETGPQMPIGCLVSM